jgi:hypothetical protein
MGTMDRLTYTSDRIPESVRDAAGDAAAQCGYDQFEEVLLDYVIVGIRRVSARSVKDHYPEWLEPPCSFSPDEIVRVDWQTWAVPKGYVSACKGGVIARADSILVAIPTLLAREVFTYGLGPEYNWLEWEEGVPPAGEPAACAFEALYDLITSEWLDDICWDADRDPRYLDDLHPDLRATVAKAIDNCGSRS